MILNEIIAHKKEELSETKRQTPFSDIRSKALGAEPPRGFGKSLFIAGDIRLIAEVKKASPSKGVIREDFDPVKIARIYEESGASCLSVLTEKKFFQGELEYLGRIRKVVNLPLLRKDFIIDEYQIHEARAAGSRRHLAHRGVPGTTTGRRLSGDRTHARSRCAGRVAYV